MKEVDITGLPSDNSESHIGLSEELYRIQEQNVKEHQDVSVYFEHSDESYRITELYQRFPMDEALRDVVRSSDFTAYVDLVGDSLEFKDQLVKLSYIKNWFDFSFKQLVANPNQRPLQLYSYPELQQAVYYGNLIRELVTKDCFVNMWSSLLPNVGLGGLPIGIHARTHGTPADVLLTAAFELSYRWHLMAKTKRLMMIAEQQKRELASEAWVQVPRVDRDYERSRESARTGGGAKEVIETQGGIPSINLEGRGKEDYDLFNRWLIGNWNYTIDRSLIDTGAGFMGLGETFPDWRPDDMTFELKEAGAIWYVWEAMQYSANMWSRALEIAYEYAMSQKTISRDSRREMKELYANSIPNDPLDALKKILSNMPSSRKQSQYLLPPTPEYGTTSEEGMDAVSNEIISRFYGDIDREIFQRIPKVPNIASLLSELIFTGDYSPTYKYGKRAESKTQTFSESEQEESVMEGDVPGVTVHGSRPRPTFNYSLRTGFTTQQEGIGLDFAYVELPEVSLDWESFFDDTQFQQIQEAVDRIETQERAERLSEILHPEPEPSPLFNLQNSLNQQDYRQDLKLFNGVYLQPSSTGNFGLDIVVEVERGNLIPLDENYLDAMLCGIFAEYSNQ